ncbi:MAG: peptidylprolyl isomerase [Verrucomicrobiales bacterium]|jgi:peptidyl-prolyl cis-trans isomerase SurA|nr:peptidylprolyl isomerase [Verrucomicrobiales bacterium]
MKFTSTALLLLGALLVGRATQAADAVNGIVALVGDSVITYEQVERLIARAIELERAKYPNQPDNLRRAVAEARKAGVETLINRRLILEDFKELKVSLPETLIEKNVEEEIKQRYGERTVLAKSLQQEGVTFESFRKEIREQFIEAVMRNRNVPRDILVSPGRIEKFYRENIEKYQIPDQVKLRMIVIDKTRTPADATRLGREILSKLDDGADFAEMAAVYSDGSQAREGGSWGWVDRKVLREDLADVAFQLPAGKRSDLIEKAEGVYIMLVEENRIAHVRPIDEVREEIERTLVVTERMRLQKAWIDKLRKKQFIRTIVN